MFRQQRLLMLIILLFGFQTYGEDGLKVSGFVDAQYRFNRGEIEETTGTFTAAVPNSFMVNQGAIYFSKKLGSGEVFVDIPFYGDTQQDPTSTTPEASNTMTLGTGQAQAFVKQTYGSGLSWTLGQFDTVYGYELNDTQDVHFTSQGIVFAIMPVTHTGILVQHSLGSVDLAFLFSNAGGLGAQLTDRATEMGLRASFGTGNYTIGAGVLMNGFIGTSAITGDALGTEQLIDVTAGAVFDKISVDFAYDMVSNTGGEPKVSATEDKKTIAGMLLQIGYKLNEKSVIALRYESVANAASNSSVASKITIGLKKSMTDELTVKVDVASNGSKLDDTSASNNVSYMDGAIGAVYSF